MSVSGAVRRNLVEVRGLNRTFARRAKAVGVMLVRHQPEDIGFIRSVSHQNEVGEPGMGQKAKGGGRGAIVEKSEPPYT